MDLSEALTAIIRQEPDRIILSRPVSSSGFLKATVRPVLIRNTSQYQIERFTSRQAFQKNIPKEELESALAGMMKNEFRELNSFSAAGHSLLKVSKSGTVYYRAMKPEKCSRCEEALSQNGPAPQNRVKEYLLDPSMQIRPLQDLGIFTKDGKIASAHYNKFRQINRFTELVSESIDENTTSLSIIDFGCGKSYLTFVLYDYLANIRHIDVSMTGLDLKKDVIEKCRQLARKYGYSGLSFEVGDIAGYHPEKFPDIVLSLHACDTATDFALYNAVSWGASRIFCVPCCQHELNHELDRRSFESISEYGLLRERFGALLTDAVRADLVQACGYRTDVCEFIEESDTPKNIMIRGVKTGGSAFCLPYTDPLPVSDKARDARKRAENLLGRFSLSQTLYSMLTKAGTAEGTSGIS